MPPDPAAAFSRLEEFLSGQSPLALLSQLTLTYLFVPAAEFQGESSDTGKWERRIEFLAGYLLARPLPAGDFPAVDGQALETVQNLLDDYYRVVDLQLLLSLTGENEMSPKKVISQQAKRYAMHVRGEAYPHQLDEVAVRLYGPHDDWFRQHVGFTIGEAITIATAIRHEYERRNRDSKTGAITEAKAQADALIRAGKAGEATRHQMETALGCMLHFGNAEQTLAFTAEELVTFSGLSAEVCHAFLHRMSQEFGYRNPQFRNTFTDPLSAPWDYNTLSERPLVCHEGKYWLPLFPALQRALFDTFYFDLMADGSYRPTFEAARGAFVETKTAEYLARIFPPDTVLLNPRKPNGEEFADVAVRHDGKILIAQCKSKPLTRPARIGVNLAALRVDLRRRFRQPSNRGSQRETTCTVLIFPRSS